MFSTINIHVIYEQIQAIIWLTGILNWETERIENNMGLKATHVTMLNLPETKKPSKNLF